MNSFFSRIGGKRLLKKTIVSLFPPKDKFDLYVEAFVGAGWVFLEQESSNEVINDKDKFVYDMWHDLQKSNREKLEKMDFTPSKSKFYDMRDHAEKYDRFYRNLYLSYYSYGSRRQTYSIANKKHGGGVIDKLLKVKERIKNTKIENKDWLDIVKKYDSSKTLFYFDPPYYDVFNKAYSHEEIDYNKIAEMMKTMKGFAILSINDVPEMRKVFKGFRMKKVVVRNYLYNPKVIERKELIIMNF